MPRIPGDAMDDVAESAVERVIESMRENLAEPLTVDEMARTARFSRFHFSRLFQRVTGISPGRYMAAMRLAKARQLLTSTTLSVTEISHQVGYSSVGTFSTRFSSSVGVSPRTYRQLDGVAPHTATPDDHCETDEPCATVEGLVSDSRDSGYVFIGIFPEPVPQGRPVSCAVLPRPGPYTLNNVVPGKWFVLAHHAPAHQEPPLIGSHGPIDVRPHTVVRADLKLRPMSVFDPPAVLALLDRRSLAALAAH
jgi:AraC family transcriptional regulator